MTITGSDLSRIYGFPGLRGSGQRIAIIELGDGVVLDAVGTYCSLLGLPTPKITVVPETAVSDGSRWDDGVAGPTAATEICASLLPAAEIVVYVVSGTEMSIANGLAQAISNSEAAVVCLDISIPERQLTGSFRGLIEQDLMRATLMGITVCCPAALAGHDPAEGAPFPASSDQVLAVGSSGLLLQTDGVVAGEFAEITYPPFSTSVPAPKWQAAATAAHRGQGPSPPGRALPDVVACDACDVFLDGKMERIQSPSVSTIVWGALLTMACEEFGRRLGFITQTLWTALGSTGSTDAVRPVAMTYDREKGTLGHVPPWAPWTGWGSPNGTALLPALRRARGAKRSGKQWLRDGVRSWRAWENSRSRESLDQAIEALRTARDVGLARPNDVEACFDALRDALAARLQLASGPRDLDEIVDVTARLVELVDSPSARGNHGYYLMLRHFQRGSMGDLDAAVVEFKKALTATPPGEANRYLRILNIAWASEVRYDRKQARGEDYRVIVVDGQERWRGPRDLVVPISHLEAALVPQPGWEPAPTDVALRMKRNLGNLLVRYGRDVRKRPEEQRVADLARAIGLLDEALNQSTPNSEDFVTCANSLYAALATAEHLGFVPTEVYEDPSRRDRMIDAFASNARIPVDPVIRAAGNLNLAGLLAARSAHGGSAEDNCQAIALFRDLVLAVEPASRTLALEAASGWASWALSRHAWTEAEEAHRAAQLHIKALIGEQHDWASRYLWTGQAGTIAAAGAYAMAENGRPADAANALDQGRGIMLSERLGLDAPAAARLPAGRRMAYLMATVAGGLALSSDDGEIWSAQRLPGLTSSSLETRLQTYLAAFDKFREDPIGARRRWFREVDLAVGFLAEALGEFFRSATAALGSAADGPPIAVVPVGPLALLPVAAAALGSAANGLPVSIVSSHRLLSERARAGEPDRVVVVRDRTLPSTGWESSAAMALFSGTPLELPEEATGAQVIEALPADGVVHFACHATVDLGSPLASHITLPNGEHLTIANILETPFPPIRLAVLSACETGVPDPYVVDEGIGLSAALLSRGAHEVIATLWPVDDISTALVMLHFYWQWRRIGQRPPVALARAQSWVRDTSNDVKLAFVGHDAVRDGLLDEASARAMVAALDERCTALGPGAFADPYYWAGFFYSG